MYLEYDGLFQRIRQHYFRRVLERYSPRGGRVLDYGCGPGDMLKVARAMGVDAVGIDASEYSVRRAAVRGLEVELGDYESMSYRDESFDLIFAQSVLEHVGDPVAMVRALRRILKPDGVLLLSAPTPGPHFWDDPTHVRPHTPQSLRTLGAICDLEAKSVTYVFAFLLGLELRSSLFFKALNLLPVALGTNLLAAYQRPRSDS